MMNVLRDELHRVKSKVHFYLSLGRFQVAEKLLQATIDEHGSLANMHNLLGLTYHKQSRFPEALSQFKKAQECNPSYTEATLNIIATLCDLSCYDQAQQIYQALCQEQSRRDESAPTQLLQGRLADRHAQCGHLYYELGHLEKAVAEYEKALGLYKRMPEVKLSLAKIFIESEQFPKAQKELEELTAMAPELGKPFVWLGILYYKTGRKNKARLHWEKAHQLSPQDPVCKAFLQIASDWPLDPPAASH